MSIVIIYLIIWFITATLCLANKAKGHSRWCGEEIFAHAFASIAVGLVWPISIWVALVLWWTSDATPNWVIVLQTPFGFIKDKIKNIFQKV